MGECVFLVWMPGAGERAATGRPVPAAWPGRAWQLVSVPRAACWAGRTPPPDPARRVPDPDCGRAGSSAAADARSWKGRSSAGDGEAVAGPLAGGAGHAEAIDAAGLCRTRAPVPGPVPWADLAGRPVGRACAGDVHRDHPPARGGGYADSPGDAGTGQGHAAGGAERGHPRRPHHRQSGIPRRASPSPAPPGRGVDRRPDRAMAAHRDPPGGRGVDACPDRGVPELHPRPPALCRLPPDRVARAAPRRGLRLALVRHRPRRRHGGYLLAATAIRRTPDAVPAQDRTQRAGYRP